TYQHQHYLHLSPHALTHLHSTCFFQAPAHHRDLHSFPTRALPIFSLGLHEEPEHGDLTEVPDDLDQNFSTVRQAVAELMQSAGRSEEHTSELQSRGHLVCRLLLEKKKLTFRPALP